MQPSDFGTFRADKGSTLRAAKEARGRTTLFGLLITLLCIVIIILLAVDLSWTHTILNNTNVPPVCNVTCPNAVFNGTVDFNGTLVCNATGSNLIVNETACKSDWYALYSNKPCGRLLYDTVNQVCVPSSQPDGVSCGIFGCYAETSTPTCKGGFCVGECMGACNVSSQCSDFADLITQSLALVLSGNIRVTSTCRLFDAATGVKTFFPPAQDDTQFGLPITEDYTYVSNNISFTDGYCTYTVTIERFITSDDYGNVNETFSTSDNFCRSLMGASTVLPQPRANNIPSDCFQPISSHGFITNVTPISPYAMRADYQCDFAFLCSISSFGRRFLAL